jgi:hypothetical protein
MSKIYDENNKPKKIVKETFFQWILENEFNIPFTAVENHARFIEKISTDLDIDIFTKMKYSSEISSYNKFCKEYDSGKWDQTNLRELIKFGRP